MSDLATILELSATGRNQECLQACQHALQVNPGETYAYKYAGKSLLALGQFEKAQQCLVKAHQLDGNDPEIVKDIGNIFNVHCEMKLPTITTARVIPFSRERRWQANKDH